MTAVVAAVFILLYGATGATVMGTLTFKVIGMTRGTIGRVLSKGVINCRTVISMAMDTNNL